MDLLGMLTTLKDLSLVVLGFGAIIFVHELGHFLAARWAGIRVLAFAVGMGQAVVSYRKGMGWRRGSSEPAYRGLLARAGNESAAHGISPTEYRINWLPLGGYVKMLGQEDMHPGRVSEESDSYQNCTPWKRMVVISAGVVLNVVTAALLFVAVFMVGLESEPATVGAVRDGSPSARAGIEPGDRVVEVNGHEPNTFRDIFLASAMAKRGDALSMTIDRAGETLHLEVTPERDELSGLMEIGLAPPRSSRLYEVFQDWELTSAEFGLVGVEPGMRVLTLDGKPVSRWHEMARVAADSEGRPLEAIFEQGSSEDAMGGNSVSVTLQPRLARQVHEVRSGQDVFAERHVLGLTPLLSVGMVEPGSGGARAGLREGDVFLRLGETEFPSTGQGVSEIQRHRGRTIDIVVLRQGDEGPNEIELSASVSAQGRIGFGVADSWSSSGLLAAVPSGMADGEGELLRPAAASVLTRPGVEIVSVNGAPVVTLGESVQRIRDAAMASAGGLSVELGLRTAGQSETQTVEWALSEADAESLRVLSWELAMPETMFEPEQFLLKAEGPLDAVRLGVEETNRVMLTTYVTFLRLFQGTVQVQHLKGPVGIAHLGTRVAERGLIWLLFFMAIISVNLAVINFLPLPILDGGQFLMLLYEQIRGKPVPIPVQNAATLAGLVLIGSVFLIVTFHDVKNLLGL